MMIYHCGIFYCDHDLLFTGAMTSVAFTLFYHHSCNLCVWRTRMAVEKSPELYHPLLMFCGKNILHCLVGLWLKCFFPPDMATPVIVW